MKRWVLLMIGAALTAGCYATQAESYRSPDFTRLGLKTIAILPVVNQTQAVLAPDYLVSAMGRVLTTEKKYAVVPQEEVAEALSGPAARAYTQMVTRLSTGQPVPEAALGQMARVLEADGLLLSTVTGFHQVPEQGPATNAQGMIYYSTYDVTVVEVKGELYSRQADTIIWRDAHLERQYMDPRQGKRPISHVVEVAIRGLLTNFPENTWAPVARPTPTTTPAPQAR